MATKSGFSSGWQGFVDHKWSKMVLAWRSVFCPSLTTDSQGISRSEHR